MHSCSTTKVINLSRMKYLLLIGILCQLFFVVVPAKSAVLSMEKCIELALQNNPDLQKQRLSLKLADEDIADQKSQNFGQLNLVSSYTHYNLPRTLAPLTPASIASNPAVVPTTEDLYTAGLVYEVALFTGFARARTIEIATLQKEMAGTALKLSREQLIYNVKTLYVNTLSLQAQKEAQVAYVKALQHLFDDIVREVQLGKKARVEQLKAAADLKNAQAGKAQIRANITIMKASLVNLMGIKDLPKLQTVDLTPKSIVTIQDDFTDQLTGLERLKATRLNIDKNSKLVKKASGALYPQIVLNAAYGQNFGPNDGRHQNSGDWETRKSGRRA